ncbi:hypothetical protein [Muribaculum caecicola]|nr:hypothetical protein [Muribaculum caecicola]
MKNLESLALEDGASGRGVELINSGTLYFFAEIESIGHLYHAAA